MDHARDPDDAVSDLRRTLTLTDIDAQTPAAIFTAPSQWMPHGRVFGGQVLAQAVLAATRTLLPGLSIRSLHGYFLRPGDIDEPITLLVERTQDGVDRATRRVQAYQHGRSIFSMIASFQSADTGLEHQSRPPKGIPAPESIPASARRFDELPDEVAAFLADNAIDVRHVETEVHDESGAWDAAWMRVRRRLPDDPVLHDAVFAYASDFTLLDAVLRVHRVPLGTPGLKVASLDHAMWWHRRARADEWFCYLKSSPNAVSSRGLVEGRIYAQNGDLVAVTSQEGMVRVPRSS